MCQNAFAVSLSHVRWQDLALKASRFGLGVEHINWLIVVGLLAGVCALPSFRCFSIEEQVFDRAAAVLHRTPPTSRVIDFRG